MSNPGPEGKDVASSVTVDAPLTDDASDLKVVPLIKSKVLKSLVQLLKALDSPAVERVDKEYHLRGVVSSESLEKLSTFVHMVHSATLTDNAPSVPTETLLRLVQLLTQYHSRRNLNFIFPVLHELCVEDSDTTLAYLPLFAVPSLRYLYVSDVPEARFNKLLSFLHILAVETPRLTSIDFDGSFPYEPSIHSACMKFSELRVLRLGNVGPVFEWTTLRDLSHLPLEVFELEVITTNYTRRPVAQENNLHLCHVKYAPTPSIPISGTDEQPELEISSQPEKLEDPKECGQSSLECGFSKLQELRIVARIDLLDDLVDLICSKEMTDLSVTLLGGKLKTSKLGPVQITKDTDSEPKRFQNIVKKFLAAGTHSLIKVKIVGRPEKSIGKFPGRIPSLRPSTVNALLSQSTLHYLKISGWDTNCDLDDSLSHLSTLATPSKLMVLKIPIGSGISFGMLHTILRSCPSLISLQCRFNDLFDVPPCPTNGVKFALNTLEAGSTADCSDLEDLMNIAQYLDALCPNLESIGIATDKRYHPDQWQKIHNFVKMCQRSRSCHAPPPKPQVMAVESIVNTIATVLSD